MLPARLSSELAVLEPLPRLAPPTSIRSAHQPLPAMRHRRPAHRWLIRLYRLKKSKPMKPALPPGASRANPITTAPERTISFRGEAARPYPTPAIIRDIEYPCRDLIMEHADPGEDSVGM